MFKSTAYSIIHTKVEFFAVHFWRVSTKLSQQSTLTAVIWGPAHLEPGAPGPRARGPGPRRPRLGVRRLCSPGPRGPGPGAMGPSARSILPYLALQVASGSFPNLLSSGWRDPPGRIFPSLLTSTRTLHLYQLLGKIVWQNGLNKSRNLRSH